MNIPATLTNTYPDQGMVIFDADQNDRDVEAFRQSLIKGSTSANTEVLEAVREKFLTGTVNDVFDSSLLPTKALAINQSKEASFPWWLLILLAFSIRKKL